MLPTGSQYGYPPFSFQTMGEDAPSPAKQTEHPVFLAFAFVLAIALLVVAGRYGWKRWHG